MKKKLLEKDGFYLALFACICLVAVGGIWFTKNNVDELASNDMLVNNNEKEDEIHLIDNEEDAAVATTTESEENLEKAKEKQQEAKDTSKLSYLGEEVVREYSKESPSYSKTLDVWEIHKGLDISTKKGQEIKTILSGKVTNVFEDDEYGISVEIKGNDDITVVYSNLDRSVSIKKGQEVKQGDVIGKSGDTTFVESEDGQLIHIEAFKGKESINPMDLIK